VPTCHDKQTVLRTSHSVNILGSIGIQILKFTKKFISRTVQFVIPACLSGRQACRESLCKKDPGQAGMTYGELSCGFTNDLISSSKGI